MTTDNDKQDQDHSNQESNASDPQFVPRTFEDAVNAHDRDLAEPFLRGDVAPEVLTYLSDDGNKSDLSETFGEEEANRLHSFAYEVLNLPSTTQMRSSPIDSLRRLRELNESVSQSHFSHSLGQALRGRTVAAYDLAVRENVPEQWDQLERLRNDEDVTMQQLEVAYRRLDSSLQGVGNMSWRNDVLEQLPDSVQRAHDVYETFQDIKTRIARDDPPNGYSVETLIQKAREIDEETQDDVYVYAAIASHLNVQSKQAIEDIIYFTEERAKNRSYVERSHNVAAVLNDSITDDGMRYDSAELTNLIYKSNLGALADVNARQDKQISSLERKLRNTVIGGAVVALVIGGVAAYNFLTGGGPQGPEGPAGEVDYGSEDFQNAVGTAVATIVPFTPTTIPTPTATSTPTATPTPTATAEPTPVYEIPQSISSAPYVSFSPEAAQALAEELGFEVEIQRNDEYGASYNPGQLFFYTPGGESPPYSISRTSLDKEIRDIGRANPALVERGIKGYGN